MRPRRVVVTGASSGIGEAVAALLAEEGWQVVGTSRSEDRAAQLDAIPGAVGVCSDIRSDDGVAALRDWVEAHGGQLDALVNNAGVLAAGTVGGPSLSAWEEAMATNFFGTLRVTRALLPYLAHPAGRIVTLSSVAAAVVASPQGPYSASKAALEQAMEALSQELLPTGARVTILRPGIVKTPIHRNPIGLDTIDATGLRLGLRLGAIVRQQLTDSPTRPADVAAAISGVLADPAPPLHVTFGDDAHALLAARRRVSDEEWSSWWASEDDERWQAELEDRTGMPRPAGREA